MSCSAEPDDDCPGPPPTIDGRVVASKSPGAGFVSAAEAEGTAVTSIGSGSSEPEQSGVRTTGVVPRRNSTSAAPSSGMTA